MQSYQIPLVPGPVSVPAAVRSVYQIDFASAALEEDFFVLYATCERKLQRVLGAGVPVTIQTGEGMLALWGALKSVIGPGDRVLAVGTGLFGFGIGDMARQIGAEVETVGFPFDTIVAPDAVRDAARRFRPKLVTAVHCETPSGTLNPLDELGQICREVDALFYVDFVASGGAVSYTHLRAHETVLDLVCRLLLEKKKTHTHSIYTDTYRHTRHHTRGPKITSNTHRIQ